MRVRRSRVVVVGGSGFVGSAITRRALGQGDEVVVVDRHPPRPLAQHEGPLPWVQADLLVDEPLLPEGRVLVVSGNSLPRPRRPWTLVLDNVLASARLAPALAGREVVLLSSIEVYGGAPAPLRESSPSELGIPVAAVERWAERALAAAAEPAPPWRAEGLCRELEALDHTGRWLYGITKLAQEMILRAAVGADRLTVLRAANLFGAGQTRVLARLVHAAVSGRPIQLRPDTVRTFVSLDRTVSAMLFPLGAGVFNLGGRQLSLTDLAGLVADELGVALEVEPLPAAADASCGVADDAPLVARMGPEPALEDELRGAIRSLAEDHDPLFVPPLSVVVPPRPERPSLVADRQQAALWSGVVKNGGPWTARLEATLTDALELDPSRRVVLTGSGTAALRMAVLAAAGRPRPGAVAVLPAFTFLATGEVLSQLGYRLRFADVDRDHWTLDPVAVEAALAEGDVQAVVAVDALGHPVDYDGLLAVCRRWGVPLVADSAPSLGASQGGRPVGTQADAHAFSMSFAKVVSAGGAGGALVVPSGADLEADGNWLRSSLLHEVHAVAALDQVEQLGELVGRRAAVAATYARAAQRWPGVVAQRARPGSVHAWVHWVARFGPGAGLDRDRVGAELDRLGVQTKAYYSPVLHHHGPLAGDEPPRLPVTDLLAAEVLALPMSSEMTADDADRVVMAVDRVLGVGPGGPARRKRLTPKSALEQGQETWPEKRSSSPTCLVGTSTTSETSSSTSTRTE